MPSGDEMTELLAQLRTALGEVDEPGRYRLLGTLLVELADRGPASSGRGGNGGQTEALAKRVQALEQEKSAVEDSLRVANADLDHRTKQLELEQARAEQLKKISDDQHARAGPLQKQLADLEAQLVDRNNQIHQAESEKEELQLKLQRAQAAAGDTSALETRDALNRKLTRQIESLQTEMEQLRVEKDAEIERLQSLVGTAEGRADQGADALLAALWSRLARAKPPLAEGGEQPTVQAAERLVDAFIEFASFVHNFDQSMRPFLTRYTRYHPSVKAPWSVYADRDDLWDIIRRTVAAKGGKHVGALRMKLRLCREWAVAAFLGGDAAVESISSELQTHLRGDLGMGPDHRARIIQYLQQNGPDHFQGHMRDLRSQKLAEAYGHGI